MWHWLPKINIHSLDDSFAVLLINLLPDSAHWSFENAVEVEQLSPNVCDWCILGKLFKFPGPLLSVGLSPQKKKKKKEW